MEKISLTSSERAYLDEFTRCGKHKVREVDRAYMPTMVGPRGNDSDYRVAAAGRTYSDMAN